MLCYITIKFAKEATPPSQSHGHASFMGTVNHPINSSRCVLLFFAQLILRL